MPWPILVDGKDDVLATVAPARTFSTSAAALSSTTFMPCNTCRRLRLPDYLAGILVWHDLRSNVAGKSARARLAKKIKVSVDEEYGGGGQRSLLVGTAVAASLAALPFRSIRKKEEATPEKRVKTAPTSQKK